MKIGDFILMLPVVQLYFLKPDIRLSDTLTNILLPGGKDGYYMSTRSFTSPMARALWKQKRENSKLNQDLFFFCFREYGIATGPI